MWAVALGALGCVFAIAAAAIRSRRRRPLVLVVPLALALTVCLETGLLNLVSLLHAVARGPLVVSHAILAAAAAPLLWRRARGLRWRAPRPSWWTAELPAALLVAGLGPSPPTARSPTSPTTSTA